MHYLKTPPPHITPKTEEERESTEIKWSGKMPVPEVGDRINVRMNGFGPSTVMGYLPLHGWLGLAVRPDVRPDWLIKQDPERHVILVFGAEIED
jgi:hypothetical protein